MDKLIRDHSVSIRSFMIITDRNILEKIRVTGIDNLCDLPGSCVHTLPHPRSVELVLANKRSLEMVAFYLCCCRISTFFYIGIYVKWVAFNLPIAAN